MNSTPTDLFHLESYLKNRSISDYLKGMGIQKRTNAAVRIFELLLVKISSDDIHAKLPLTEMIDEGYVDKDYRSYTCQSSPETAELLRGVMTYSRIGCIDLTVKMLKAGFHIDKVGDMAFVDCLCAWHESRWRRDQEMNPLVDALFDIYPDIKPGIPVYDQTFHEIKRGYLARRGSGYCAQRESPQSRPKL